MRVYLHGDASAEKAPIDPTSGLISISNNFWLCEHVILAQKHFNINTINLQIQQELPE
ncbi:hypothetical protein I4U23_021044 [Adineta vaga]|nr:hypothetical protein I4U23_021044 [Adineta vaga]